MTDSKRTNCQFNIRALYKLDYSNPECVATIIIINYNLIIDTIQNYVIVIATAFRHFEWGQYQLLRLRYIEIR